jgi:hypothetical protein
MPKYYEDPTNIPGIEKLNFANKHAQNVMEYEYAEDDPVLEKHWFHRLCVNNPWEMTMRFHGPENSHIYCYWGIYDPTRYILTTNYWLGHSGKQPVED